MIVTFANGLLPVAARRRPARRAKASRAGWSTCAGSRRCRSTRSSQHAGDSAASLVVDETRRSGGVGEAVLAALVDHRRTTWPPRGASPPSTRSSRSATPPLCVLVSEDDIVDAVRDVAGRP